MTCGAAADSVPGMDLTDDALWPPLGLRVVGAGLELVWARDDLLLDLARLAAGGVHDEASMPFGVPWTRGTPVEVARSTLQYNWRSRGSMSPDSWDLALVVRRDGEVLGMQGIMAKGFPVTRVAESGSWLGRAHHGQGIGSRMRLLILHLLFDGFDARAATTTAFADNAASLGVTRKLGYRENGMKTASREGAAVEQVMFRMERADWEARPEWMRLDVELHGVGPVRELLGIPVSSDERPA